MTVSHTFSASTIVDGPSEVFNDCASVSALFAQTELLVELLMEAVTETVLDAFENKDYIILICFPC